MERSNVPAVINTCKNLAAAYHSSINFSKAIHDAQVQVVSLRSVAQLICTNSGSKAVRTFPAMGVGPVCLY